MIKKKNWEICGDYQNCIIIYIVKMNISPVQQTDFPIAMRTQDDWLIGHGRQYEPPHNNNQNQQQ